MNIKNLLQVRKFRFLSLNFFFMLMLILLFKYVRTSTNCVYNTFKAIVLIFYQNAVFPLHICADFVSSLMEFYRRLNVVVVLNYFWHG